MATEVTTINSIDSSSQVNEKVGGHIFISYSSKDREFAVKLAGELEQCFEVWIDRGVIEGGMEWEQQIETAIYRCELLIIIVSPNSNESSWVDRETILAEHIGKERIPVLLKGDLPFRLLNLQFVDFRRDFDEGFRDLVKSVKTFMQPKEKIDADYPQRENNHNGKEDLLTVFQAAPLACVEKDGELDPIAALDFEFERGLLTKAFQECGANIQVDFEIATTDGLGLFLAKDKGRILHFSAHGHPNYFGLEGEWGGMDVLEEGQLQQWILAGGKSLQFVFVSACHPTFIGQAFVNAGVEHVVCCTHDSQISGKTSVEFEKSFYRSLACGKNLQEAFDIACSEILFCSRIQPQQRQEEVKKFSLLPPNTNHDVEIFFQEATRKARRKRYSSPVNFPPPPHLYIGRELDQYLVLQALRQARLVRVSGEKGVGKTALVKACCQHLNDRLHMVDFIEILWFPHNLKDETIVPFCNFKELFNLIQEDNSVHFFLSQARDCIGRIVNYFHFRKTLLVVDVKDLLTGDEIARLCVFLEELIKGTLYLKVLVIHRLGDAVTTNRMPCAEESFYVEQLSLASSVALFVRLCPHLTKGQYHGRSLSGDLSALVVEHDNSKRMTKRLSDIFEMIGKGNPLEIHSAAKNMTPAQCDKLIALCQLRDGNFQFNSRAALTSKLKEISEEISKAAVARDFVRAHELQVCYDDLELQKRDLPDFNELQQKLDDTVYKIELAVRSKDWLKAKELQEDLDKLEMSLKLEKDVAEMDARDEDDVVWQTRASLEAKLMQLDEDYKKACDQDDFAKAREINAESKRLQDSRSFKPSRADLAMKAASLKRELENAKAERNLDAAEMVHQRLSGVLAKLKVEEEAEVALGIAVRNSPSPAGSWRTSTHSRSSNDEVIVAATFDVNDEVRAAATPRVGSAQTDMQEISERGNSSTTKTQISADGVGAEESRESGAIRVSGGIARNREAVLSPGAVRISGGNPTLSKDKPENLSRSSIGSQHEKADKVNPSTTTANNFTGVETEEKAEVEPLSATNVQMSGGTARSRKDKVETVSTLSDNVSTQELSDETSLSSAMTSSEIIASMNQIRGEWLAKQSSLHVPTEADDPRESCKKGKDTNYSLSLSEYIARAQVSEQDKPDKIYPSTAMIEGEHVEAEILKPRAVQGGDFPRDGIADDGEEPRDHLAANILTSNSSSVPSEQPNSGSVARLPAAHEMGDRNEGSEIQAKMGMAKRTMPSRFTSDPLYVASRNITRNGSENLIEADLVQDGPDLEKIIMETVRKNTVEAVEVESTSTESPKKSRWPKKILKKLGRK